MGLDAHGEGGQVADLVVGEDPTGGRLALEFDAVIAPVVAPDDGEGLVADPGREHAQGLAVDHVRVGLHLAADDHLAEAALPR